MPEANAETDAKKELHLTFVVMLFALAIGEVAIDVANLVNLQVQRSIDVAASPPAYCHLLLAAIVIAASWVGWRNSGVSGTEIKSVFSLDFVELLIDVLLVVCYFLLARLAELPTGSPLTIVPDASPEAWMIMVIMAIYVVWDILSCRSDRNKWKRRVWASIICSVVALLVLWKLPLSSHDGTAVILMDTALLGLVFLFRALKLHDWGEHTPISKLWIGVAVFVFLASSIFACRST